MARKIKSGLIQLSLPKTEGEGTIAEIVEGGPTDRLMGARVTTLIGRSTQAGPGAGIEAGVPQAVVRRTRPVTDLIEISPPGGLPRSAEGIEVVEGRVAGLGAGAGLQEGTLEISKSRRMRSGMGQLQFIPSA